MTTYTKFSILVDPSLAIINVYLVCLINAWDSEEKDFFFKNAFSKYDLYGHTLAQEPLPQGS